VKTLKSKSPAKFILPKYSIEAIRRNIHVEIDNRKWDLPELRNLLDKML
jgi:hypothetical protein